jgi:hypothetical protein
MLSGAEQSAALISQMVLENVDLGCVTKEN